MAKAELVRQVCVTTSNEVGEFANVAGVLADAGINMSAICAWGEKDKAQFVFLTNSNAKALAALAAKGLKATEQEAVALMLEDKVGATATVAKKIKGAGINLDYVYGTACGCQGSTCLMVLVSKESAKLRNCLNA